LIAADDQGNGTRLVEEDIEDDAVPARDEPVEATGEPRVDEALRRLGELGDLPVAEHPPVFERVHASLVDVLGELRPGVTDDSRRTTDDQQQADPQR
jgi:hypothetical protein